MNLIPKKSENAPRSIGKTYFSPAVSFPLFITPIVKAEKIVVKTSIIIEKFIIKSGANASPLPLSKNPLIELRFPVTGTLEISAEEVKAICLVKISTIKELIPKSRGAPATAAKRINKI